MATFAVDTSFLNQPAPKQQTLGDLVNMAGGIQNYQQAQQLNPVQLENAQTVLQQNKLGLQKAQALIQPEIEAGKSKAEREVYETKQKYANELNDAMTGMIQSKAIQEGDVNGFIAHVADQRDRLIDQGMPKHIAEREFSKVISAAVDPKKGLDFIKQNLENTQRAQIGAQGRQALITPQSATMQGQPVGFVPGTNTYVPSTIQGENAPVPNQQQGQVASVNPNQPNNLGLNLDFPVRSQNQAYAPSPQEVVARTDGQKYKNDLISRQKDLSVDRRNLDETLKTIDELEKSGLPSTGVLGSITRGTTGALGTETGVKYKQLSKDLATVQISNLKASGGSMDTVAGQQLQRMANGDETYPTSVLKNIAMRTYADVTNLDMQATAADKFAKKFGDANMNSFKQLWSKNADSNIFQIMNIAKDNKMSSEEKQQMTNQLLGISPKMTPEQQQKIRQDFNTKYQNLQKLTNTGTL
jgi:hypothetical protein